jgi:hypothetical protein
MIETIRKNADLFCIPVNMRLRFLKTRIEELHEEIDEYSESNKQEDAWAIYCLRENRRELEPIELEAKTLIRFLRDGNSHETRLAADMIATARKFSFRKLLKFKGKMTLCPFHDDRTPSMALYDNRVRCFVCNWSWDTIEFVMKREGLNFKEAVRRLTE